MSNFDGDIIYKYLDFAPSSINIGYEKLQQQSFQFRISLDFFSVSSGCIERHAIACQKPTKWRNYDV